MNILSRTPGPLLLVSSTIVIQLMTAWLLGTVAASSPPPGVMLACLTILAAIGLNLFRFIIWGYTHRLYPLSHTYPLTALFFPCVLILSYVQGDGISLHEVAGTLLITIGALGLNAPKGNSSVDRDRNPDCSNHDGM